MHKVVNIKSSKLTRVLKIVIRFPWREQLNMNVKTGECPYYTSA